MINVTYIMVYDIDCLFSDMLISSFIVYCLSKIKTNLAFYLVLVSFESF